MSTKVILWNFRTSKIKATTGQLKLQGAWLFGKSWPFFTKLGKMLEGDPMRPCSKYYIDWPKGGAIATDWNRKLWTAISQAPLVLESWHFAHICHYSQARVVLAAWPPLSLLAAIFQFEMVSLFDVSTGVVSEKSKSILFVTCIL